MPYERALTQLAFARFLRRRRQRRAAVALFGQAGACFAALRAEPASELCTRELEACGLSPKPAAAQHSNLTPQELAVVRLVLAGMTNREVASELIVSAKTVEVHLTRVYAKLAVKSRNDLRAKARAGQIAILL